MKRLRIISPFQLNEFSSLQSQVNITSSKFLNNTAATFDKLIPNTLSGRYFQ
jgi:hypothetical protein